MPHELSEKNFRDRIIICTSLLTGNIKELFLNYMITDDEKRTTYENIVRKRTYFELRQTIFSLHFKTELNTNKRLL